jgi:hypothetical protein
LCNKKRTYTEIHREPQSYAGKLRSANAHQID